MTPAEMYREMFDEGGRRVTIERKPANEPAVSITNVRARITGADAEEIAGGNTSTVRRVIVLAEDVPASFRPLRKGDKILVDGLSLGFTTRPDDQTRRDGETLLAYEGIVAGA